ncbi:MAG TPA: MG2 domain-containing protein [Pyrinomonadaceae bacterium]|nr:MG2 domain-containing protein [Pyrinomonadaceae bacterium]
MNSQTRRSFNHKFRNEEARRTPLNVADYARVPLLNPDQLVTTWREPLTTLENEYDRRMIPLGKQEPGVYLVEAVEGDLRAYTVVVVTDLAMVEKSSPNGELLVYAVNRVTGEPQSNTQITIVKARKTVSAGTTNGDGIFRAQLNKPNNEEEQEADPEVEAIANNDFVVFATHRENFAISDLASYYFDEEGEEQNVNGYIYTDRPIYRPNHKVFFKGILRALDDKGQYRQLKTSSVTVLVKDPNDALLFEQEVRLSAAGAFAGELMLGEEAPLGTYQIEADTEAGISSGTFEVAEYKKPEYKVSVAAPQKFVAAGSKSKFDVSARYFFGAPVAGAEVKYYVYRSRYYPYYFGEEEEREDEEEDEEYAQYGNYNGDMISQGEGKLDTSGRLQVDFDVPQNSTDDMWDFEYRLEAEVTDKSRRTINASASLVATRGSVIARAWPDRYVYTKGDTAEIEIATTDYEGRPVAASLTVKMMLRTWEKVEKKEETDPGFKMIQDELSSSNIQTDQQGRAKFKYTITHAGNIAIETLVKENGKDYTSIGGFIWVSDKDTQWSDSAYFSENYGSIKLVPDKKSYRVGETARVLAILPHQAANLLVTTEVDSILSTRFVKTAGNTVVLDVPIEASYAPNVYLSVTFVHDGDMFSDVKKISVPARDKMLNLEIIPNKSEYKPRETASYTILARDADGAPVRNAEVSLGVVDEAIYSLASDYSGNIRSHFYGTRYNSVATHLSISYTFTGYAGDKPMNLAANKPSYQLADFKNNQNDQVQPMIRKDFRDTAFWQPSAITGADGRANVKFRLPDNLTTWRATARGVTNDLKVGVNTSKVLSRKDVILRLETPRFMTQGDTVTLSGVVHNYLKEAKSTQIQISVVGANLIGPAQQTVTIDQQGEHRIDWQISAPQTGQVQLLAKALTNTESDAVELTLDVVPRGLREVKVERWETSDEGEKQFALDMPANADMNSRKLRVEVSPSIAGTLFGALDYLTTYPYGCTEQTMSSFLPNVIVSQTLKDIQTTSIRSGNDLKKKVERGRNRLYAYQHEDGGWGWWKDDATDPFMTAYVVDGLTLARQAGYEIDDTRIARGRERLEAMLQSGKNAQDKELDAETRAFMVYALAESGGVASGYVDRLFGERGNLEPYGRALLALTLSLRKDKRAAEVASEIERSARSGNGTAYWHSKRQERLDFADQDETEGTALSLKALVRIKPDSSLIPQAARWLVSDRSNSYYWNSTKDTAFAIYGLIEFVKASRESADYDLEIYVNGENVLTEHVSAASAARTFVINRAGSAVGGNNHVRVVKRGKGQMYLSSSVEYYTNEDQTQARGSADLNVTREYYRLAVAEENYQLKWSMSPLDGEIQSGDLLVVKLRLTGKQSRHLMLEDPIPSGAEQLESVGNLNLDYNEKDWSDWYSSREFRDRRTVFFIDSFDGDHTLQYAIRVQVPGNFVVAPSRAELMYRPEVYANTASGKFSFIDRSITKP